MSQSTNEIARQVLAWTVPVIAVGWFIVWTIRRAEEPLALGCKWLLTGLVAVCMVWKVAPIVGQGGYSAGFVGIPLTMACGLVLAIIWRRNLSALVAEPFGSLYDGGKLPPEPRPAYSIAEAKQKQGKYLEAIVEIRKQLGLFPTDFEGHMLLARIQAEDLKDLPGAELTIQRLCSQPGHAPANITFALYSLADWHLGLARDRAAARRALEQVIALLPESEFALNAAQRIAHLSLADGLMAHEHKTFTVAQGPSSFGLVSRPPDLAPTEPDPGQLALEYVQHLETHPLDTDAREHLAELYLSHYRRLDLAADQLEQMIQQPSQPARLVVRWLNLLADFQVRGGADYDTVRHTLQRIIERAPNLAAAEMARKRLELLRLEFKAQDKNQPVKLGVYEQNIGLKQGRS